MLAKHTFWTKYVWPKKKKKNNNNNNNNNKKPTRLSC